MITLIVSSYKPQLLEDFRKNIAATIGQTAYEIIAIHNPGIMGICEAYNQGAENAKYENLLFIHEDVKFYTENWYSIVEKYYNLPQLGVFGLAGSKRKFHLPYGFHSGMRGENFIFVNHSGHHKLPISSLPFPFQVKVIDGVFIGMKKEVWKKVPFSKTLKGFHFYDLDISLRTSVDYKNYLVTDLDVEHFSTGNFGDEWIKACINFHKDNTYNYDPINPKEQRDVRNFWYTTLLPQKINLMNRLRYIKALGCNKDTVKACMKFLLH